VEIRSTTRARARLIKLLSLFCLTAALVVSGVSTSQAADKDKKQRARLHREAKKATKKGDYQKAIRLYSNLLGEDDRDIQARLGAAFASMKAQDYQLGYDHVVEALKDDPNNAHAHALAGLALLRSGYLAAAAKELILAFKLDPKEALAYGAAAEIDFFEGRSKDSRVKALYAYNLDPDEPDYLITLARSAARLEYFAEAAKAYELFLDTVPRSDTERRDRVRGLIQLYRRLAGLKIHQISGAESAELPFHLGRDRRPYIKLQVNGQEATFVIDTGSGFTVISNEAARRLGVSEIARGGKSQGFGGNGHFPIVYGLLRSIQLGGLKVDSVPCFIRPFHTVGESSDPEADGFIGLSILSSFLTELDYEAHTLRLNRNFDFAPQIASPEVRVIPFRTTQNGLISIETELDGNHRINAILDSAAGSVVVSQAAVERFNLRDSIIRDQTARVIGAAGITDNVELLFVRNLGVADLRQTNLRALVLDFDAINETSGFEQGGIIGGDFLKNYSVTIDFARTELRFKPRTSDLKN
jgi:predicted aspartyl protease/Flp pilus assembly protein TadD